MQTTTKAVLADLQASIIEAYNRQIDAAPFKPKQREDIKAGFADGVHAGIWRTICMLEITVEK